MSLPSNTNASLSTSFYAPRDAGGAIVGVTSLNGLIGIVAVTGDASVGVSTPGLGAVQVSTAGKPQVPSSVTATGAIVGATVAATGALTAASANIAGALTAGNMVATQNAPAYVVAGGTFQFIQVGSIGIVAGSGVSNSSGYITGGLPPGRTGSLVSQSGNAWGANGGGLASMYAVVFTGAAANQFTTGTIDRTTGSSQAGITASIQAWFVMTN